MLKPWPITGSVVNANAGTRSLSHKYLPEPRDHRSQAHCSGLFCISLPGFPTPKLGSLPHQASPPCLHSAIPAKSLCKGHQTSPPAPSCPQWVLLTSPRGWPSPNPFISLLPAMLPFLWSACFRPLSHPHSQRLQPTGLIQPPI